MQYQATAGWFPSGEAWCTGDSQARAIQTIRERHAGEPEAGSHDPPNVARLTLPAMLENRAVLQINSDAIRLTISSDDNPRLLAYAPAHADHGFECRSATNPSNSQLRHGR